MCELSSPPASLVDLLIALRSDDDAEFDRNLSLLRSPKYMVDSIDYFGPKDDAATIKSCKESGSHPPLHPQSDDSTNDLINIGVVNERGPPIPSPSVDSSLYLSNLATQFNDPKQFEVVKTLFVCPVLAAIPRLSDGAYPLHIAACIGDELLGRFIAMAYPAAMTTQNAKGKIPLHFAAREGNIEMVEYLLQICPESAKIATHKKKLALHFAAAEGFDDVCKLLLDAYPGGASEKTSKGKLPLHFASRKGSTECLELLLSAFPEGSQLLDWEDSPPLHVALREGREHAAVRLIEQCPDVLRIRNMSGEFPLNIAVGISSMSLLSHMINLWPGACKYVLQNVRQERDFERWSWSQIELLLLGASGCIQGRIFDLEEEDVEIYNLENPENHFCKLSTMEEHSDSDMDSICDCSRSLFGQIDSLIPSQDQPRSLPLHAALYFANNTSFIRCVIEKCPDLIERPDIHGRYPLHIAASRSDLDMSGIGELILEKYPLAAMKRDENGMLPLHIAICKRVDSTFVKAILTSNLSAAARRCKIKDAHFENKRPLYLAVGHGCGMDIIYMLIRADPNLAMYGRNTV